MAWALDRTVKRVNNSQSSVYPDLFRSVMLTRPDEYDLRETLRRLTYRFRDPRNLGLLLQGIVS